MSAGWKEGGTINTLVGAAIPRGTVIAREEQAGPLERSGTSLTGSNSWEENCNSTQSASSLFDIQWSVAIGTWLTVYKRWTSMDVDGYLNTHPQSFFATSDFELFC